MSIDGLVKVIEALTKLLGVLVWPALLAYILARFGPALREFFFTLVEFSFKGGGFEATVKRKQAEARLGACGSLRCLAGAETTPESAAREAKEAADVVAESVNPRIIRRASEATSYGLMIDQTTISMNDSPLRP